MSQILSAFFHSNGTVAGIQDPGAKKKWETFHRPFEAKQDVSVLFVLRITALSSSTGTWATVLVGMRESRLRKSVQERISCIICTGMTANRMVYVHEALVAKSFIELEENLR